MSTVPSPPEVFAGDASASASRKQAGMPGWLAPVGLVLLGLALRLYSLNRESVGFDEAFSMVATRESVAAMMRRLIEDFVHPPLHYFVLRGWLDAFGSGVWQARLLSVVFGSLSIGLLYLVTKQLFGRRSALLSSLLLAISQLGIMFAQEARPYAQFLFFFLATWYLFVRALRARSVHFWCACAVSAILLIYTHYFGLFVLGALVVCGFFFRKEFRIPALWWIAAAAVIALAYVPWLSSGIFDAAAHSSRTFSGKSSFWSVSGSTFFTAVNFFGNGKPNGLFDSSPLWTFFVGGLLFAAPAAVTIFRVRRKEERWQVVLTVALWALPILGAIAAGKLHFQYNVRYVAFCAAPYYVLVGHGISLIRPSLLRAGFVVLLLGYTANALRANYFMPKREDFRAAGSYIRTHRLPGDCGVFLPGLTRPQQWTIEQPDDALLRIVSHYDFTEGLSQCGRIWAVVWSISGNPWQWEKARSEQLRLDSTHSKIEEKRFYWVHLALYSRKQP